MDFFERFDHLFYNQASADRYASLVALDEHQCLSAIHSDGIGVQVYIFDNISEEFTEKLAAEAKRLTKKDGKPRDQAIITKIEHGPVHIDVTVVFTNKKKEVAQPSSELKVHRLLERCQDSVRMNEEPRTCC